MNNKITKKFNFFKDRIVIIAMSLYTDAKIEDLEDAENWAFTGNCSKGSSFICITASDKQQWEREGKSNANVFSRLK